MKLELVFDTHGNERQKEAARHWCDDTVTDIVYGGSKGSGKSYLGCSLVFGDAFIYPGIHLFIARKKLNDLRKYTLPSIYEVFNHWGIPKEMYKFNANDNYFELSNGSKIFLLEGRYRPEDPQYQRFGSMQMTRGWIEEAGEFDSEAKENLMASVGRWMNDTYKIRGKVLQSCNPSKNYLYTQYYKPNKIGQLPEHIRFVQALPQDNKILWASGYFDHLLRTLSKNQRERLLNGNWEYDDDPDALCSYESIAAIFKNDHVPLGQDKFITADVARFGSDKAIVAVWSGWVVIEFHVFDKSKTTDIQKCISAMRMKHQVPLRRAIADEDGVGGGVVDNLNILGFTNNARALLEENYNNLQSQCCYRLSEKINSSGIWIKCEMQEKHKEEIIEELEQLKEYENDGIGKLKILPKEKIKDNIGRSPDWRDVLMMRAFFDLSKDVDYHVH